MLFDSLLEYPIVLAAACMLRPSGPRRGPRLQRTVTDIGFAMLPMVLASLPSLVLPLLRRQGLITGPLDDTVRLALMVGLPVLACYAFVTVPARFAIAVGALLIVNSAIKSRYVAAEVRTFFGLYTVQHTSTPQGRGTVELLHGTTLHGAQWLDPATRSEPLIYYHRDGPIGDVFRVVGASPLFDRVALVGLGSGTLAAYGRNGQTLTFFEIDPAVIRLARDFTLFHYLGDSRAQCEFTLGDARLSIAREPDGQYGAIVLDAFSSDAVPVHLITREAVRMYVSKLKPGGLIAFHVSNRYLDLERVVSGVTRDLGLAAVIRNDDVPEEESARDLHWSSTWIAAARSPEDLAPLVAAARWTALAPHATDRVWTDDYSSFVGIFQWQGSR
jgi:SAM-dependent methyltransferase